MSKSSLLWVGGIATAGYLLYRFYSYKQVANQASLRVSGVSFEQPNIFTARIKVQFTVTNPTTAPVTLNSITGDVILNGEAIGKIAYLDPKVIAASSSTVIPVNIDISTLDVVTKALSILKNAWASFVRVTGTVNFSFGSVPFDQTLGVSK